MAVECAFTYRNKKLFDFLQCVAHPGVGLGRWGEHLDEHVQVFVQVLIFGLAALPQLFLLVTTKSITRPLPREKSRRCRGNLLWTSPDLQTQAENPESILAPLSD